MKKKIVNILLFSVLALNLIVYMWYDSTRKSPYEPLTVYKHIPCEVDTVYVTDTVYVEKKVSAGVGAYQISNAGDCETQVMNQIKYLREDVKDLRGLVLLLH